MRRRRGRKRATGTRRPMVLPSGPNQRWSLDFVSDALTDGRRFRTLCVVDDFTREALAIVVDTSLSGVRVGRELDRIIARRGRPAMIVSDNGTELTSHASCAGKRSEGSNGITSHRASLSRMASCRASTAALGSIDIQGFTSGVDV